ncbi:hypothetical protein PoB_003009200 [Plakobranchus ocellatus]|uniref:Uncharacterized protein n=1 Tax=Plakobranchus ocellatus TaxID=259542 RepID=A0AAV4A9G8_9GAST|nr:hypothetical protein PoB_003009200 [Plakobranchus ocellatus]
MYSLLIPLGSAQQVAACSPSNSTPPLTCTPGQWVKIIAELYAPQQSRAGSGGGANCQVDLTSCNVALFGAGLEVNCNGPVLQGADPCREEINVTYAREQQQCVQDAPEVATLVQYSCIEGADVYDLCTTTTRLTSAFSSSFQMMHMTSPGFPATSSSGNLCTCHLQGSKLRVQAVEVKVDARLPWQDDVTDGSQYEAVLSIRNGGNFLYKSNECADCTSVNIVNTLLVSTGQQSVSDLNITYSDFGLSDQKVWLEITDLGPDLNITCTSSPLPSNRVITTTTTTTTTTTPATQPATRVPGTVSPQVTSAAATTSPGAGSRGGGEGQQKKGNGGGGGGGSDDSTTIVVLVILLILLFVGAGVFGYILYRRRGKCRADGKEGLKPMLVAWYRDLDCAGCCRTQQSSPGDDQHAENERVGDGQFDGAAVGGACAGQVNRGYSDGDSRKPRFAGLGKNVEVIQTEEGETTIIHNEVYQAHRELVEEEVAKMKQHKREQRAAQALGRTSESPALHVAQPQTDPSGSRDARAETAGRDGRVHQAHSSNSPGTAAAEYDEGAMGRGHYYETIQDHIPSGNRYEQWPLRPKPGALDSGDAKLHRSNSAHSDSDQSLNSESLEEAKPVDNKHITPPTNGLLSPEEKDMFAALGLPGDDGDDGGADGGDDSNINQIQQDTLHQAHTPATTGNPEDTPPPPQLSPQQSTPHRKDGNKSGNPRQGSKVKKTAKPELVSDILELSLRDIKGQRKGQGGDGGSGSGDSKGGSGDNNEREAETIWLDQERQVQMTEC